MFDAFIVAYPSKRYRSALIGIAVHSAQSVLVLVLALTLSLVLASCHIPRPRRPVSFSCSAWKRSGQLRS